MGICGCQCSSRMARVASPIAVGISAGRRRAGSWRMVMLCCVRDSSISRRVAIFTAWPLAMFRIAWSGEFGIPGDALDIGVADIPDVEKITCGVSVPTASSGGARPASMRAIWPAKAGTTKSSLWPGPVWLKGRRRSRRRPSPARAPSARSAAALVAA